MNTPTLFITMEYVDRFYADPSASTPFRPIGFYAFLDQQCIRATWKNYTSKRCHQLLSFTVDMLIDYRLDEAPLNLVMPTHQIYQQLSAGLSMVFGELSFHYDDTPFSGFNERFNSDITASYSKTIYKNQFIAAAEQAVKNYNASKQGLSLAA